MLDRNSKIKWEVGRAFQLKDSFLKVLDESGINYGEINVYDGISMCSWGGGRFVTKEKMKYENISSFYKRNINISIPMTNSEIDIMDNLGNETLDRFHRKGNRIILCNDKLRKHIKSNYPLYSTSFSITASYAEEVLWTLKGQDLWDYYKRKLDEYDVVVIPKELLEPPLFDKLHRNLEVSRLEFVIDNDCYLYCKEMGKMYRYLSMLNRVPPFSRIYDQIFSKTCLKQCHLGNETFEYWYSKERLQSFIDMGLVRFKIARHEEYPKERMIKQWLGYFVDYNVPDKNPKYWEEFHSSGKCYNKNLERHILDD